jgi:hypothetical protein
MKFAAPTLRRVYCVPPVTSLLVLFGWAGEQMFNFDKRDLVILAVALCVVAVVGLMDRGIESVG